MNLKPCPCGQTPDYIISDVYDDDTPGSRSFLLRGSCCRKWAFERRSTTLWPKKYQVARWWNAAPRGEK